MVAQILGNYSYAEMYNRDMHATKYKQSKKYYFTCVTDIVSYVVFDTKMGFQENNTHTVLAGA